MVRSTRYDTCCRRSRRPDRKTPARSPGPIRHGCAASWRVPGSRGFLDPARSDDPAGGAGRRGGAADFMMTFGPLTRILSALSAEQLAAVRSGLEAFLRGYDGPQGVVLPAANWLVQ